MIAQLARVHCRMPVLIYERVRVGQYLLFFSRYRKKLLFVGNMSFLAILWIGRWGYQLTRYSKYASAVWDGLREVLIAAKLDDSMYRIIDWFQNENCLVIYIAAETRRMITLAEER